jgi:putative metallohydrolase (TIGR04338 family)
MAGRNVREGHRDTQRAKLYRAESEALPMDSRPRLGNTSMMTIEECQKFIDHLLGQKTVRDHFPTKSRSLIFQRRNERYPWKAQYGVVVVAGRGCHATTSAWSSEGIITLARFGRNPAVLCHELAHILERRGAAHGWEFAETYLWLVKRAMGKEAHDKLKASFKKHKVRYTKPRTRKPLTPEQKAAAVERLAAARAAKAAKLAA